MVQTLISRNFFEKQFFRRTHTHGVEIKKIYSQVSLFFGKDFVHRVNSDHQKNISSNRLFNNLFSKTVTFTKLLPKLHERGIPQFPHCGNEIAAFTHHFFTKSS